MNEHPIVYAKRRLFSLLIANAHRLDVPFVDAPDESPWTKAKPAMSVLDKEIRSLLAEVERLKGDRRALDIAVTGLRELETEYMGFELGGSIAALLNKIGATR